jgi:hypothetical protein
LHLVAFHSDDLPDVQRTRVRHGCRGLRADVDFFEKALFLADYKRNNV